jgi:hypothetical protein
MYIYIYSIHIILSYFYILTPKKIETGQVLSTFAPDRTFRPIFLGSFLRWPWPGAIEFLKSLPSSRHCGEFFILGL